MSSEPIIDVIVKPCETRTMVEIKGTHKANNKVVWTPKHRVYSTTGANGAFDIHHAEDLMTGTSRNAWFNGAHNGIDATVSAEWSEIIINLVLDTEQSTFLGTLWGSARRWFPAVQGRYRA